MALTIYEREISHAEVVRSCNIVKAVMAKMAGRVHGNINDIF